MADTQRAHAYGPMDGRIAVVTGATNGIGRVTARELARAGARVVLMGRDEVRTPAVREEVARETGSDDVHALVCDLRSFAAVREASRHVLETFGQVDVLCNNAGLITAKRTITEDGNELTFQVNYLSPFLMTHLIRPALTIAAPSRVICVSSDAHLYTVGGIRFDDLTFERGWSPFRAYAHSKLADIMFAYALARRWAGTGVSANAMHPGTVNSGFGKDGWGPFGFAFERAKALLQSPEQGADTLLYLASAPEVEGSSGLYYYKRAPKRSSGASYDRGAQDRLWRTSLDLVGLPEEALE